MNKKIAVIAGTPVDTQMGVDYLNAAQFASPSRTDGVHMDNTAHCNLARAVAQKLQDIGI